MIQVTDLTKSYKGKVVVDGLNMDIEEKEAFALLGSNGAGKSTTIKMMLRLVKEDRGMIRYQAGKSIGYSPESPCFPLFLTGREVLVYYARLQKFTKNRAGETADKLLKIVGLEADRTRVKHYSKGMLQRLALAQALIGDPEILLLDEPCAGLDAMGRIEMLELLKQLKDQGKTIVINSHILSDIERLCERGIIMDQGRVLKVWHRRELAGGSNLEDVFTRVIGGRD